ncbi:MAG TPA: PP2C family protein-serine/threonine phosphatase [Terriglobales bacterium]|jgi:serine phosphatase RsbU (regulator of sigma subunit)
MTHEIDSSAFHNAILRTERLRILGSILIICIFCVIGAIRIYLFGSHMNHIGLYCGVVAVGYELLVYLAVQRSIKGDIAIPDWFWTINVIIEMSVPALAVAFLASAKIPQDYRPLVTSWALLFFPFLVLSTLRLSPVVSGVAGVAGGIGYLLAASYQGWHIKSDLATNSIAHSAVPFFALMILVTGLIAALVAREIRAHFQAALREAETERALKQMEHDLSIARSIQQSLLPKVRPKLDGYEIAGWNRSADSTGGDYFDWKELDNGSLAVTLADVTGHGIGPALLASVCRAYSRASFSNSDSLAGVLQRINQSFGQDLAPGRFATFVAAICHAEDDELELLSAGHGPLFWYSAATGELKSFPAHDVPLGILPKLTSASSQIVPMQTGDLIFLITDGFLEWENSAGEQFGTERFEKVVRTSLHLGPEEIIEELYRSVLSFADGTPQADDLTAVIIKKTARATAVAAAS